LNKAVGKYPWITTLSQSAAEKLACTILDCDGSSSTVMHIFDSFCSANKPSDKHNTFGQAAGGMLANGFGDKENSYSEIEF